MGTFSVQNYLSACIVFFAAVSSVTAGLHGNATPAMVGLSIAYAINVSFSIPKQVCKCQTCEFIPLFLPHIRCLTLSAAY